MSGDLRERFAQRMTRLRGNLDGIAAVFASTPDRAKPGPGALPAFAWLLEASYSDIEEVFKSLVRSCGDEVPNSLNWHRELLDAVSQPTPKRAAAVTTGLKVELEDYLQFRHFARYSTFLVLDWAQMKPLVDGLPRVVERFRVEMEQFLAAHLP
ncbi:MAG TPA: hypothetical protein VFD82_19280 [Planctomycetota bacterium]|nr:hypothetical protein [Planctomycetota bacterium]